MDNAAFAIAESNLGPLLAFGAVDELLNLLFSSRCVITPQRHKCVFPSLRHIHGIVRFEALYNSLSTVHEPGSNVDVCKKDDGHSFLELHMLAISMVLLSSSE